MRINETIAVSTPRVLLVPYDPHHVERYHEWMQNVALREATASDLLSLDEEYENQQSWRTSHDKLTFIVCQPAIKGPIDAAPAPIAAEDSHGANEGTLRIHAGEDDTPARMIGDINLFLTADDNNGNDGENEAENKERGCGGRESTWYDVKGEIDIMIAVPEHRRQGLGEAAVSAFLRFLAENIGAIMSEYSRSASSFTSPSMRWESVGIEAVTLPAVKSARLRRLVAKIHASNAGSVRLFDKLGFKRDGEPDYFNEISLVLSDFPSKSSGVNSGAVVPVKDDRFGYQECLYDRSRLGG
ncbi:acetyltransferase domain-containing protein [Xylaria nigripes]|nr:acetyltransferase domain-containing protein [Xylaria nigripes]